ncbi:hypothetical protein PIB30_079617, partial [Stylosanthes scabra]|nr:hypothetical protein [Stylosanthes scabra]
MGNCAFKGIITATSHGGVLDNNKQMVKVMTSNGGIMELCTPITVHSITNEFPGHAIFPSPVSSEPLLRQQELHAGQVYYLLPINPYCYYSSNFSSESIVTRQLSSSTSTPYRIFTHDNANMRSQAEESSPRRAGGVWKVKLVISPEQLSEILSEESLTEALIESLRTVAKCGKGVPSPAVKSSPPEDPVKCTSYNTNCTVTNSIGIFPDRTICQAGEVKYPTTEEELISIVATATKNNRKMKATTRYSHSIPKLACPDGKDGLLISTNNLNKVLKIDADARTMTVESGVTLRQIITEAAGAGLALPYTPYWWGITIGGLMATGAHGSTLWGKGSAVHEYVTEIRIVSPAGAEDGYAKVRVLTESDGDDDQHLNAARVSLGVLGVISQVTLKLEPMFKRSVTYLTKDDKDLGEELINFGREHEFADVSWYPSQKKAVYRVDDRVPLNTSGDGLYDFLPFRPTLSAGLAVVRSTGVSSIVLFLYHYSQLAIQFQNNP